jgi:hypothetical protein
MSKLDSIINKIKALQAKAQDSSCTENEQAAFAAKVSELLTKHNLDREVLNSVSVEDLVKSETLSKNLVHPWRANLGNAVAQLYFCKMLIITVSPTTATSNAKKRLMFFGKDHNRVVAISMFEHFEKTIKRLATEKYTSKGDIDAFERGCGLALASRILEVYDSMRKPQPTIDKSVPALFESELQVVENWIRDKYQIKPTKSRSYDVHSDAARAGLQAAENIPINNQLT